MELKKILGGLAIAATMAFAPMTASAVTNHSINGSLGLEVGPLGNGSIYGDTIGGGVLGMGDTASVNIFTDDVDTESVIGFNVSPVPLGTSVDIALSGDDIAAFTGANITLATAADGSGSFASSFVADGLVLSAEVPLSPFFVIIDWAALAASDSIDRSNLSWSYNVSMVPLPAGFLLLLTGVGGLALVGRRRRMAAAA